MSIIAEYETRLTQLQEALQAVPETAVEHEEIFFTADDEVKWLFWATGGNRDAFGDALAEDSTVETARAITETPTRTLYRATLVGEPNDFTLTHFNELDIQILAATHDHDASIVRVRCPSREAYSTLGGVIEEQYGRFKTRRLFEESASTQNEYDVTPAQKEALLYAFEAGYYSVPRNATLESVAAEFGISDNAASARLRRGTAALLEDTLARE